MNLRSSVIATLVVLLVGCGSGSPSPGSSVAFADPDVARIHQRMMSVIAPDRGWERARYIEFDRVSPAGTMRHHRWDRWEGRARVEGEVDGGNMVALFDTDEPMAGRVWLDGVELEGEAADELLTVAYRSHINDGYWLLMPFKWDDPGVSVRFEGERQEGGRVWDVIELSFGDGIGLTPQNLYHAFIDRDTGRMELWHHFPTPDASPAPSEWTDWQAYGPIQLARNRRLNGEIRSFFPHLRVETSVPDGVLDPPK